MAEEFRMPDFNEGDLELRYENDVVCIYGTQEGLKKLSDLCLSLIDSPKQGHIHLENESDLLTKESQPAAMAIF